MSLRNKTVSLFLGFLIIIPGLLWAQESPATATIKVGQISSGNVVVPSTTPVSLPVEISALPQGGLDNGLGWELYNGWNMEVARGTALLSETNTHIDLPLNQSGLYVLKTHLLSGGKMIAEATTNLAVLTPYDLSQVEDSPFGVDTHYGHNWDSDSIPLYATMGAKFLRDGTDWSVVEQEKGVMKITEHYQSAMDLAAAQHMNVLQMLAFGNKFYYPNSKLPVYQAAPYTQEGYDQYTRYCKFMVDHFQPQPEFFEIWNEYNGGFAQGPAAGRPEIYAAMIKTAYPAIKKMNPKAFVVGLSTAGLPMSWIEEAFKHGALNYMDGVAVHPYGYSSAPESMEPSLIQLRALICKYNHGKEKPIWATEQGWYQIKAGESGNREPITEFVQAEYLVRGWTVMLGQNLQKMCWYVGQNNVDFPTMGLIASAEDPRGKYAPKPAYVAYGTLIRELTGFTFSHREKSPPHIYDYLFTKGGEERRVLWATRPDDVALAGNDPVTVTDMFGGTAQLYPVNGMLNFHLTQAPVYVSGKATGLVPSPLFHLQIATALAKDQPFPATLLMSHDTVSMLHGLTFVYGSEKQKIELSKKGDQASGSVQIAPRPSLDGEAWTPFQVIADGKIVFIGSHHALLSDAVTADRFPRLKSLDTLQETVTNVSQTQTATVQKIDYEINGQTETLNPSQVLQPGSTFDFQLPVKNLQSFTLYPVTITLTLADGTQIPVKNSVSYNPVPHRTITVDGSLDDWDLSQGIDMDNTPYVKMQEQRRDAKDLGGKIYFAADDKNIYMAAVIEDNTFFQSYTGANVWRGDSIQIGITSLAPWTGGEWAVGQQEFEIALTPDGPEMVESGKQQLPGVKIVIKRKGTQTIYEAALPWTALQGVKGPLSQFSWAVYINDNDGQGRKGYLQWADIKSLSSLQPFYFNAKQ